MDEEERITGAALRRSDGTLFSLPAPARHNDVKRHMREQGITEAEIEACEPGFITSKGRWAWRKPALHIARRAEQLIREPMAPGHGLFSEDVW